jgi:hypothetical protein
MMETFLEEETINYEVASAGVSKLLEAMATQFHCQLSSSQSMQYKVTVYDSHTVPDIQLADYLHRLSKMSKCIYRDLVVALVYIDKLINNEVINGISFHNVHRLIAIALMISTKFFDDVPYSNKSWSQIVGIPLRELNSTEVHFLQALNFDLGTDLQTMYNWSEAISRFAGGNLAHERQMEQSTQRDTENNNESNQLSEESDNSPRIVVNNIIEDVVLED